MVHPDPFGDIRRVPGDQLDRSVVGVREVLAQEGGRVHDPDQTARRSDRVQLSVGHVARVLRQRVGARVAGDQRARFDPGDVPEPLLVEVAEIDEDPQLATARHQSPAGVGQPAAGVRARRRAEGDPLPEPVRPAPHRAERAQPRLVPERERLQLRVDRLGPLDVQHGRRRQRRIVVRGVEVRGRAGDRDRARQLERGQPAGGAGRYPRRPAVLERIGQRLAPQAVLLGVRPRVREIAAGAVGEHREDRAPDAARAHPRKIEVAARLAGGELRVLIGGERIVVSIEHGPHRPRRYRTPALTRATNP